MYNYSIIVSFLGAYNMIEHTNLANNIHITKIYEPKFKEVLINLKVVFELNDQQNTVANILSRMMNDRTTATPTKEQLQKRLDFMYGTKTSSNTYTAGKYQVIDIAVKSIHAKFTDEPVQQAQVDLLADMFYEVLINEETVNEAKDGLRLHHARIKESSAHYAQQQAFLNAAPDSLFSVNSFGTLEAIETVTVEMVKDFHQTLVEEAFKSIYIVGDLHDIDVSRFNQGFSNNIETPLIYPEITEKMMTQHHAGGQTEIVSLYATDIDPYHDLYAAYLVFVAYLGQLPSSLLFQNIREKHSLAYSIYASRQLFDGVMIIATGINDRNLDKTLTLIQEQFEIMKQESLDIQPAIQYLNLGLEGTTENLKRIADRQFRNELLGVDESIEALQEKITNVTVEQVKEVIGHLGAPFTYAYRAQGEGDNNHE